MGGWFPVIWRGLPAPWVPVHWIVGVLEQIGAGLVDQSVRGALLVV